MTNRYMVYASLGLMAFSIICSIISLATPWYQNSMPMYNKLFSNCFPVLGVELCAAASSGAGWGALVTTVINLAAGLAATTWFALLAFKEDLTEKAPNLIKTICQRQPGVIVLASLLSIIIWCAAFPYENSEFHQSGTNIGPHAALIFAGINMLVGVGASVTAFFATRSGGGT